MGKYTMTVTTDGEGFKIDSEVDGINALEILGILDFKRNDIMQQINGEIKPDIKRTVIEHEPIPELKPIPLGSYCPFAERCIHFVNTNCDGKLYEKCTQLKSFREYPWQKTEGRNGNSNT